MIIIVLILWFLKTFLKWNIIYTNAILIDAEHCEGASRKNYQLKIALLYF